MVAETEAIRRAVRKRATWIISRLPQAPAGRKRTGPERDSIRVGDTTIEYEVRRSERRKKSVHIRVEHGVVRVVVPSLTKSDAIRRAVRERADWIINRLSQAPPEGVQKRFVNGESLPYMGEDVRIAVRFADVPSPDIRLDEGHFLVAVSQTLRGRKRCEAMRRAFIEWYSARAAEQVSQCVDKWWPKLGRGEKSRVFIRNQRRRWGSCASDGTLRDQLAHHHAGTRAHRVHRGPRTCPSERTQPLARLQESDVKRPAGLHRQAETTPARWKGFFPCSL